MNIEVTKQSIENGRGFKPDVLWFVDMSGYSFGSYNSLSEAMSKQAWLTEQIAFGWTAREIYWGEHGPKQ